MWVVRAVELAEFVSLAAVGRHVARLAKTGCDTPRCLPKLCLPHGPEVSRRKPSTLPGGQLAQAACRLRLWLVALRPGRIRLSGRAAVL